MGLKVDLKEIDPCTLCLMELDENETDDSIRARCEVYGTIKHFRRSAKNIAFVNYADEG